MARAFGPRRAVRVDVGQGAGSGATALSAAELAAFESLDVVYRALCALLYDYVPTDESQVVLDSFGLPCNLRFWVRVTAS